MKQVFPLKISVDLSFYFGILTFFNPWKDVNTTWYFLGAIVLFSISAAISSYSNSKAIRIITTVAIFTGWIILGFAYGSIADIIAIIPFIIYYCVILIKQNLYIDYVDFLQYYKILLLIYGFFLGVSFAFVLDYKGLIEFGSLLVLTGVFLLHQLRFGEGADKKIKMMDIAVTFFVTFTAFIAAAFLHFLSGYSRQILSVFKYPLKLFGILYGYMENALEAIMHNEDVIEYQDYMNQASEEAKVVQGEATGYIIPEVKTVIPWHEIFVILFLIAGIIMLIYIIKKMATSFKKYSNEFNKEEYYEAIEAEAIPKKKKKKDAGSIVRNAYIKYLQFLINHGLQHRACDSSQDIYKKNMDLIRIGSVSSEIKYIEGSEKIREIYIKTRYQEGYTPDDEEIQNVKDLLKLYK